MREGDIEKWRSTLTHMMLSIVCYEEGDQEEDQALDEDEDHVDETEDESMAWEPPQKKCVMQKFLDVLINFENSSSCSCSQSVDCIY